MRRPLPAVPTLKELGCDAFFADRARLLRPPRSARGDGLAVAGTVVPILMPVTLVVMVVPLIARLDLRRAVPSGGEGG